MLANNVLTEIEVYFQLTLCFAVKDEHIEVQQGCCHWYYASKMD